MQTPLHFFSGQPLPSSAELFLGESWAADRQKLRHDLQQALKGDVWRDSVTNTELNAVLDLRTPPRFARVYVSISHTAGLGGFVIAKQAVGLDLEHQERVTERIVRRVSSAEDVAAAPSPAHLWVAKEAAFKALQSFQQPDLLSELSIGGWRAEGNGHRFQLRAALPSQGFIEIREGLCCGLCFLH